MRAQASANELGRRGTFGPNSSPIIFEGVGSLTGARNSYPTHTADMQVITQGLPCKDKNSQRTQPQEHNSPRAPRAENEKSPRDLSLDMEHHKQQFQSRCWASAVGKVSRHLVSWWLGRGAEQKPVLSRMPYPVSSAAIERLRPADLERIEGYHSSPSGKLGLVMGPWHHLSFSVGPHAASPTKSRHRYLCT